MKLKKDNQITRLYKNTRWMLWLKYFFAGLYVVVILSLVYQDAVLKNEVSKLRNEIKKINQYNNSLTADEIQFVRDLKKERESLMKMPEVQGF